jgi:hypothetical protein
MKLIILEGQDNLGKTTVIREICKDYKSFIVRKFSNPPKELNLFEKEKFQQSTFLDEFRFYTNCCKNGLFDQENTVMIWDRSHIGEQVYGPIYRKSDPSKWLNDLEKIFDLEKIYLILLEGDHEFVMKNEDGHSLVMSEDQYKEFLVGFNGDKKLKSYFYAIDSYDIEYHKKLKIIESLLFLYGFEESLIPNKLRIKVDEEVSEKDINFDLMRDMEKFHNLDLSGLLTRYRRIDDIMNEVKQFIHEDKQSK